ncbi:MAG: UvrABC system protein A [Myxococcota bacterium]|nr:UvrABC system protein A [Myxococcota bacterium]
MDREVSESQAIVIKGAREHNLQNVNVTIPKRRLVVVTGVSGSGKSSLAFDTLYAEGQRRYVESLSSYARQFLGQMEKPHYDHIKGLSPTISIEQKTASNNPRSTVGTITEIADYLRVLYARTGVQHCHQCGARVGKLSAQQIVDEILKLPAGAQVLLMAPIFENRKGEYRELINDFRKRGFARARINKEIVKLENLEALDKKRKHSFDLVVDRITARPDARSRITDSVETALREGKGVCAIVPADGGPERRLSEHLWCHNCQIGFPDLSPQSFSFNSPLGACPQCNGLGSRVEMDPEKVIPDPGLTIREGAIKPFSSAFENGGWTNEIFASVADSIGVDMDTPWKELTPEQQKVFLHGAGTREVTVNWEGARGKGSFRIAFEGVLPTLMRRFEQTQSEGQKVYYSKFLSTRPCTACGGKRLRPESAAVKVGASTLPEISGMTIDRALEHFRTLPPHLSENQNTIAAELLKEINSRLIFLHNVGLGYLSLDRPGPTLSGGESQRIRLASQIGTELTGVTYVLDEPSIGLHQRDNRKLLQSLKFLRDIGNTVVVVEHDAETMMEADWILDFGPGAGRNGGHLVAEGTPPEVAANESSLTGAYLSGRRKIGVPAQRRAPGKEWIEVIGARENNLKNIDVRFPLHCLVAVTGVSGAGKSTLVNNILYPALMRALYESDLVPGMHDRIEGLKLIDKVVNIDQDPIGRTPRSNPATYTKVFDEIRGLFAQTPEARAWGYDPGRFSFNVKGGRCEACQGDGVKKVEMHFLADVYVPCEVCEGKRFNDATLRVRFKEKNIHDVLQMQVSEALEFFAQHKNITRILQTLDDVGMGYVALGQPSPTLSGGEAQRIKLSRELARPGTGKTVYILDEPTTGLHFEDVRRLLEVLQRLADKGNTVIVIEHNLDVIKCADWIVDIGPEGGDAGGRLVAEGTPEQVARMEVSHTGRFLREMALSGEPPVPAKPVVKAAAAPEKKKKGAPPIQPSGSAGKQTLDNRKAAGKTAVGKASAKQAPPRKAAGNTSRGASPQPARERRSRR